MIDYNKNYLQGYIKVLANKTTSSFIKSAGFGRFVSRALSKRLGNQVTKKLLLKHLLTSMGYGAAGFGYNALAGPDFMEHPTSGLVTSLMWALGGPSTVRGLRSHPGSPRRGLLKSLTRGGLLFGLPRGFKHLADLADQFPGTHNEKYRQLGETGAFTGVALYDFHKEIMNAVNKGNVNPIIEKYILSPGAIKAKEIMTSPEMVDILKQVGKETVDVGKDSIKEIINSDEGQKAIKDIMQTGTESFKSVINAPETRETVRGYIKDLGVTGTGMSKEVMKSPETSNIMKSVLYDVGGAGLTAASAGALSRFLANKLLPDLKIRDVNKNKKEDISDYEDYMARKNKRESMVKVIQLLGALGGGLSYMPVKSLISKKIRKQ